VAKAGSAALPLAPKLAAAGLPSAMPSLSLGFVALIKPLAVGMVSGLLVAGGVKYVAKEKPARPAVSSVASQGSRASDEASKAAAVRMPNGKRPSLPLATPAKTFNPELSLGQPGTKQAARVREERRASAAALPLQAVPSPVPTQTEFSVSSQAGFVVEGQKGALEPAPREVSDSSLKLEIEQLDRARRALLIHDPERALRELTLYRALRPSGVLELEAQVIRIRALEKLGQRLEAEALAREFVRRYPKHRHAQALESQFKLHARP
jgi:hypothetical protein